MEQGFPGRIDLFGELWLLMENAIIPTGIFHIALIFTPKHYAARGFPARLILGRGVVILWSCGIMENKLNIIFPHRTLLLRSDSPSGLSWRGVVIVSLEIPDGICGIIYGLY